MTVLAIVLIVILLIIIANGIRIVNQYERGVVFRLGKVRPAIKEPGLRLIIPIVDQMRKVNMQIVTLPVDSQQIITKDNVSIDVAAVAYYQVLDPIKSVVEIQNVVAATYQIAQKRLPNGVSLSVRLKSRTLSCRTACSGPWPSRPRLSVRSAPKSSLLKVSSSVPPNSVKQLTSSLPIRSPYSFATSRS
jgi:hypothetical protein